MCLQDKDFEKHWDKEKLSKEKGLFGKRLPIYG